MKKLAILLLIIIYSCGSTRTCEEKCGPDPIKINKKMIN